MVPQIVGKVPYVELPSDPFRPYAADTVNGKLRVVDITCESSNTVIASGDVPICVSRARHAWRETAPFPLAFETGIEVHRTEPLRVNVALIRSGHRRTSRPFGDKNQAPTMNGSPAPTVTGLAGDKRISIGAL